MVNVQYLAKITKEKNMTNSINHNITAMLPRKNLGEAAVGLACRLWTTASIPALVLVLGLLAARPAPAAQNGLFGGPLGGSDIRSAYLPTRSGVYMGVIALGQSAD